MRFIFGLVVLISSQTQARKPQIDFCKPSVTTASGTQAPHRICGGDLIFEENFDTFDLSIWQHEITLSGSGNQEFQWYGNNRSNSYVEDGVLYISPTLTSDTLGSESLLSSAVLNLHGSTPANQCTDASSFGCERSGSANHVLNPIRSARIRTSDSFNFKYGIVEVRAQTPKGDWLWPAIWLLPRYEAYGPWPQSGEIDLMESRGNEDLTINGVNIGSRETSQTLHFGPYPALDPYITKAMNNPQGFDASFHLYKMKWTPHEMVLSIDDHIVNTIRGPFWENGRFDQTAPGIKNPWMHSKGSMAPFDQEFYFIINLAVGSTSFFPDQAVNKHGTKPWNNNSPQALTDFWNGREQWLPTWNLETTQASLKVDYVKVWALDEPPATSGASGPA